MLPWGEAECEGENVKHKIVKNEGKMRDRRK